MKKMGVAFIRKRDWFIPIVKRMNPYSENYEHELGVEQVDPIPDWCQFLLGKEPTPFQKGSTTSVKG